MNTAEIALVIGALKSLISLIEAFKPSLATNKVVIEIQSAITALEAMGL